MTKVKEPESMEECDFFSRRVLAKKPHQIMIWVPKGTTVMNIKYVCAECGHEDVVTDKYELPYTFVCEKCGEKIIVKPLKGKAKGHKKKSWRKKKLKE